MSTYSICFLGEIKKKKNIWILIIWATPCENLFSVVCQRRRPRSACTSMQSGQGLHCLLTETLDTTEYMNGEQKPG